MSYKVSDLILASMRVARVLDKGEVPDNSEMNDAMQALTMMLHAWAARNLMVRALVQVNFPLVAGKDHYTIGVGGDFNMVKPLSIPGGFLRDSNNVDTGLDILTKTEYDSFQDKIISESRPTSVYYDPGLAQQANQMGTIYVYYIPDNTLAYTMFLDTRIPFTDFSHLTDVVTFETPYEEAIKYELAVRLWAEYHRTPLPNDIAVLANEAIHTVEMMNSRQYTMVTDLPGAPGTSYNIYLGGENQ